MDGEIFPRTVLTGRRLRLRPFGAGDAADVHAVWHDERYVRTAPVGYPFCGADLATALEWCANGVEQHRLEGRGVSFAVEPLAGGRLAGHVAFFGTNWAAGVTEIHYWTAPWARGNGYAAEAAGVAARWALADVGLARVTLLAAQDNAASRHVAEAAGFRFEGLLRSATPARAGGRADLALYSMIAADLAPA
jgi:ribosomal-protein-alanine N-acetyltransferase